MNTLDLSPTRTSPAIRFEPATGTFEITGISIPENATAFYKPIVAWLAAELPTLQGEHVMDFRLTYFNSTSLKAIYMLLKEVKTAQDKGVKIQVRWHAEADDDLLTETVVTFREILDMPMELVLIDDEAPKTAALVGQVHRTTDHNGQPCAEHP